MSGHQPNGGEISPPEAAASRAKARDEHLLFATDNGGVRHCACRDVLILSFLGHWMALTRPQYRDFHAQLIGAVRCPMGRRQLNEGGRFAFRDAKRGTAFTLGMSEMEELLGLLDSARFMLDARDAAAAGLAANGKGTEDASWRR